MLVRVELVELGARRDEALAAIDIDELIGPPQRAERDGGSQP